MVRRPDTARRRPPAGRRILPLAACAATLIAGFLLRAGLPPPPEPTPDEIVYTVFSATLLREGPSAQARLLAQHAASDSIADLPPPTRIGYSWLGSGSMWLAGSATVQSLRLLSTICSLLSLVLLCAIAATRFDGWTAAIAVALLAASPADLAIARRAWADAAFALCSTAMLWAYLMAARRPGRWPWPALVLVLGGLATLVKEAGVLLIVLGSLGLSVQEWRRTRRWQPALLPLAGGVAGAVAAGVALSLASGGAFDPWWTALERTARAVATNQYVRTYQTGSPLYYVRGLMALQPVMFLLGLAGAVLVVARVPFMRRSWERPGAETALASVAWMVLLLSAAACAYTQKNVRFLSPIFAPVALLAAAFVRAALATLRDRLSPGAFRLAVAAVVTLLLAGGVMDLQRFAELFLRHDVPDLATPWLLAPPGETPR